MNKFVLFCKSYHKDLKRILNLIKSIEKHNKDNIPLFICVPQQDYKLFETYINTKKVSLITDESVVEQVFSDNFKYFSLGYMNQQLVKLNFWKLRLCENYMCIDSDAYFIKDFYLSDFMHDEKNPYSVLYHYEEHFFNKEHIHLIENYKDQLTKIKKEIGFNSRQYLSCCGFAILSSKVLESFETKFLIPNKLSYIDILTKVPLEFSWYNQWLLKDKTIDIFTHPQFFKIFHYKDQYDEARKKTLTEADISRMYFGICMNSNWYPFPSPLKYKNPSKVNLLIYNLKKAVKIKFFKIFRGLINKIR